MDLNGQRLLSAIPATLRKELLDCYEQIIRNYIEGRWEPAELNGGKFCEVVYSILSGAISGSFPAAASKPPNIVDACRALESAAATPTRVGDRSLRIQIPRLLPFLYEIRNNRGVGHVGGDVSPNHADAEMVRSSATWLMAELVRIFHGLSLPEATRAVESLVEKKHPIVWDNGSGKRVLDPSLPKADQALVLLYSESDWLGVDKLCEWVEYSSLSKFKRRVVEPLHAKRMLEFDRVGSKVKISPAGIRRVEESLLR